jgi:plasmid stabilization system protein ParE
VTRRVVWARGASDDFKEIIGYLAERSPASARRVAAAVLDTVKALGAFATGRVGRVAGTYEIVVSRLPYIIAYAIDREPTPEQIVVLRIIHGARDWREGDWPD